MIARYATHYEYDALGRMIRSTNPNGVATWFIHDGEGRLRYSAQGMSSAEGVKNAQAEITEWRYNAFGDQTEQIRYVGRLQLAVPNSRQSLQDALSTLSFTAANDARQQFTYNANGQVITATDTLGVRTLQAYNIFGQLERVERAAGTSRGMVTTYSYDRRGLQLQTVQDAGTRRLNLTQSVRYDAFGRAVSQTDARGASARLPTTTMDGSFKPRAVWKGATRPRPPATTHSRARWKSPTQPETPHVSATTIRSWKCRPPLHWVW